MKFLKRNIKWIIAIIVGIVIASGISVYATSQYLASQVSYTTDENEKIENVADALDDLYRKSNEETIDLQNILYAESNGVQLTNRSCSLTLEKGSYLVVPTFGFASAGWGSTSSSNLTSNNYLTGTNNCSIQFLSGKRVYAKGKYHILWTERYAYKVIVPDSSVISFCVPIGNADNNNGTMVSMYAFKIK